MTPFGRPFFLVCGLRTFEDRGRWMLPTVAALVALGIGGVLGAKPAWRQLRTQRAMQILSRAEPLADQGNWDQVAPLLRSSLALAPTHLRGFRLAARYFTALGSPQALVYWEPVLASGTASYLERRSYAALTAQLNRPDLCRPVLNQLVEESPSDPQVYRIGVLLARRLNQPGLRLETAEKWLQRTPQEPEAQFEVGRGRWRSTHPEIRRTGGLLLWGLAFSTNRFSRPAIATLAASTHLTSTERNLLWRQIDTHPPTNQVVEAELRLRLRPEGRSNIVHQLVAHLKPDASEPEMAATLKWLADHGEIEPMVSLLTPARMAMTPNLQLARIQALIELGRAGESESSLETPPAHSPLFLIHCLRASAAHAAGKPDQVLAHLELASAAATSGHIPGPHIAVARFAEQFHQPRIALARWRTVAEQLGGGIDAVVQVTRLARQVDDLAAAQPSLAMLRNQMHTDVGTALLAGYVDHLVGRAHPDQLLQLREIARTNSPNPLILGVLALAEWKNGDPAAGLRVMESGELDWSQAEPRMQAVYAGILGAAGQREAARIAARRTPAAGLVREEQALIESSLH